MSRHPESLREPGQGDLPPPMLSYVICQAYVHEFVVRLLSDPGNYIRRVALQSFILSVSIQKRE